MVRAFQIELALLQGGIANAGHWAQSLDFNPAPLMNRFYVPQLTQIKALLAQGTPTSEESAAALLGQLRNHVESIHNTRILIEVLALQALLDDAQGKEPAALYKLEQAVRLAEPGGWIRSFVDLGPRMANLLERLRSQIIAKHDTVLLYLTQILEAFPPERLSTAIIDQGELIEPLTVRELEILALLAQQLSNKEIAAQLVITKGTVKQHTHNIYQKLDVKTRGQAVAKATEIGILLANSK